MKIIIIILCILGLNVLASDTDTDEMKNVFKVLESVFKPSDQNKTKSKPVDIRKIYITRTQLDLMMESAKTKGKKEGYKEGYRDGYKDGYKDMSISIKGN